MQQPKNRVSNKPKITYLGWAQLSQIQQTQAISIYTKIFAKENGGADAYMKRPGIKYAVDESGNIVPNTYRDPYMLGDFFR